MSLRILNRDHVWAMMVMVVLLVSFAPLAVNDAQAVHQTEASAGSSGDLCVSNGFLAAQVNDLTGMFTFDAGSCATAGEAANYILYPLGTSFITVADFTTRAEYTEFGQVRGTSLGAPVSSSVVGGSIITVFPHTAEGLDVTQNITVTGSDYSNSAILMKVKVVNTNSNPQEVGVRYLWDAQVGGFDGTWLREYDGKTAGVITGYETSYDPPSVNFTSYEMAGCSQGSVVPPPYTCSPSDFGAGGLAVFGSISSGPGATTPSRFVYGWWEGMFETAYGYLPNPSNEIGSYVPNVGGSQDSAMLYYFSNETLAGAGGILSDQADVTTAPTVAATSTTSSTAGLYAAFWKGTFFGSPVSACVSERSSPAGAPPSAPPTTTEIDPNIAHGSSTGFLWDVTPPGFSVNGVQFFDTTFSVAWTGYIYLSANTTYYFQLTSDDGSWLYINTAQGSSTITASNLLIRDSGSHPPRSAVSKAVRVPVSGKYAIEVDYYETCHGKSGIDLSWAKGSPTSFSIIPSQSLSPAAIGSNAVQSTSTS